MTYENALDITMAKAKAVAWLAWEGQRPYNIFLCLWIMINNNPHWSFTSSFFGIVVLLVIELIAIVAATTATSADAL